MNTTPVSLLERLRQPANHDAWSRFVQLYTPLLHYWVRRTGFNDAEADDLVQEVFAVLVQKMPGFVYDKDRTFVQALAPFGSNAIMYITDGGQMWEATAEPGNLGSFVEITSAVQTLAPFGNNAIMYLTDGGQLWEATADSWSAGSLSEITSAVQTLAPYSYNAIMYLTGNGQLWEATADSWSAGSLSEITSAVQTLAPYSYNAIMYLTGNGQLWEATADSWSAGSLSEITSAVQTLAPYGYNAIMYLTGNGQLWEATADSWSAGSFSEITSAVQTLAPFGSNVTASGQGAIMYLTDSGQLWEAAANWWNAGSFSEITSAVKILVPYGFNAIMYLTDSSQLWEATANWWSAGAFSEIASNVYSLNVLPDGSLNINAPPSTNVTTTGPNGQPVVTDPNGWASFAATPLFDDGSPNTTAGTPVYTDVQQGNGVGGDGDCWLMASLAEVAYRDPNAIKAMFTADGDGIYTVRLFSGSTPVYVTVSATLPETSGTVPYAQASTSLWVALVEKAYAQWDGGSYQALNGGNAGNALAAITGVPQALFLGPIDGWLQGAPVVFNTGNPLDNSLVPNHCYAMLSYDPVSKMIQLYNPWGQGPPEPPGGTPPKGSTYFGDSFWIPASVLSLDFNSFS